MGVVVVGWEQSSSRMQTRSVIQVGPVVGGARLPTTSRQCPLGGSPARGNVGEQTGRPGTEQKSGLLIKRSALAAASGIGKKKKRGGEKQVSIFIMARCATSPNSKLFLN